MKKNLTYEIYFWLYTSLLQAINFIGCLKKLKFRLFGIHWTQPRKRKEKVNLKERRRTPVKKIWNLREERPCAMSLRNCKWCQWLERWESENIFFFFFFFLFRSGIHLLAETTGFRRYVDGTTDIFFGTKQRRYLYWFTSRYGIYRQYQLVRYRINFLACTWIAYFLFKMIYLSQITIPFFFFSFFFYGLIIYNLI